MNKKILHICLLSPVTDGWGYQDNIITKYHRREGNKVTIITTKWVWGEDGNKKLTDKKDYYNEDEVKMIRLDIKGNRPFSYRFKRYIGFEDEIRKAQPDILFVHGCAFIDMKVIVRYVKEHPGIIVYVDNHADFSNSATNWIAKNVLHKIIWRHYAHMIEPYATKFYGVLPARVNFLIDMYKLPPNKCELLVMGADDDLVEKAQLPEVKEKIRQKYGISGDDFLIISGGKIDAAKKQTLLLMDAVNQICNPKLKLIIFGSVTAELKEEVAKRCSTQVNYIGWLQSRDSYEYFASADLVVFPGRHSVFWEQVAGQGIPMLVKYWDGTTHIDLGGNVKFLYNDSVYEIKEQIERLICDTEEYQKMKYVAEKYGMQVFSYNNIATRSIDYEKLD